MIKPDVCKTVKINRRIMFMLGCLLALGCGSELQAMQAANRSIEAVANEYLEAMLERFPERATERSLTGFSHDELFDNSLAALTIWQLREDAWLREIEIIGTPKEVGSRDWVTYGVLKEQLASAREIRLCRNELWNATNTTAWHTRLPYLFDVQPLETPAQRSEALARLNKVAHFVETEIANLRTGLELGYSAPKSTVAPVPNEIRALLADDNPFIGMTLRANDAEFTSAVRTIFTRQIAPAIEHFATFIESHYLPAVRVDIALSFNPDGAECYPRLVRYFTTINRTPDEIHNTGLNQIASIRAEMKSIINEHFGGVEIETFLHDLNFDPQYTFRSEEEVLRYSVDALDSARDKMPEVFGLLPRADVLIKPYPAYRASGTGEYNYSSEDGTRPGIYYIAVVRPRNRSRAIQQSVLYHETYPGHHLQLAIQLELGERVHPLVRTVSNSGYVEGWGLYAERLADELDLYSGPLDRMGMLSDQAARAARLVVDTGLHTRGWSRQRAINYMLANTAWPPGDIESEISRYISWPGQATSYMLGMVEIRRLRTLAEDQLGKSFDLGQFHNRVLEDGAVTLPMLDAKVKAWIDEDN